MSRFDDTEFLLDHENLRDDRAEFFNDRLPARTWKLDYDVRATTVGRFDAPPVHVEEMYHPDVFGQGASDSVEIR